MNFSFGKIISISERNENSEVWKNYIVPDLHESPECRNKLDAPDWIDSNCAKIKRKTDPREDVNTNHIKKNDDMQVAFKSMQNSGDTNYFFLKDINFSEIPETFWEFFEGENHQINHLQKEMPEWFNLVKFKRGQMFAMDHYFSINFAEMISLFFLFSFPEGLNCLMYTKQSHTPYKAFRRYLSTVNRVKSWYQGNIWDPDSLAYKNLNMVRQFHSKVDREVRSYSKNDLERLCDLENILKTPQFWCPSSEILSRDFGNCPFKLKSNLSERGIDQMQMCFTQFGFMGLIVAYPEKFGIPGYLKKELEGFVHVWQVLGYLLGIEDKYNFCKGSFNEVQERCQQFSKYVMKRQLMHVTREWEHMSRCMVEGISFYLPGLSFEVSYLYLCWVLDIQVPEFSKSVSWRKKLSFFLMKIIMTVVLKIPGVFFVYNRWVNNAIARITSASPEILDRLAKRKYSFQIHEDADEDNS